MRSGRSFPTHSRRFGAHSDPSFSADEPVVIVEAENLVVTLSDGETTTGVDAAVVGTTDSDTGTGVDAGENVVQGQPTDADFATAVEDAIVEVAAAETGTGTDSQVRGLALTSSDVAPATDSLGRIYVAIRAWGESLYLPSVDVVSALHIIPRTTNDNVSGLGDALTRQRVVPRVPTETLTTSDVATSHLLFAKRVVQEPFGYSQTVLHDGPAGYWRFGELSGDAARDATTHGLDGAYKTSGMGAYSLTQAGLLVGDSDTAVQLDSTNGPAWVQIAHDERFQIPTTGKLSVSFWIRASSFAGADLVYKSNLRDGGNLEWAIGELGLNQGWYAKVYASDGTILAQAVAAGPGKNSLWVKYHVAMVWDGFNLKLYLNGAVIASGTGVGDPATTFGPVWVGDDGAAVYDELEISGINYQLGQVRARYEAALQPSTFDTLTRSQVLARAIADSCTTGESLQAIRIKPRTSSDTVSAASDVLDRIYLAIRGTDDAVPLETEIGNRLYTRVIFDIAAVVDQAVPIGIRPRTGTDAVATATDVVARIRIRNGLTNDTTTVSETAVVTHSILARIVPDPVPLTDDATRSNGIFSRTAYDIVHIGVDWALTNGSHHVRATADTITSSDAVAGWRVRTRLTTESLVGLSDVATKTVTTPPAHRVRTSTDTLSVSTDVLVVKVSPMHRKATDTLSLPSDAVVVKVSPMHRYATDTLSLPIVQNVLHFNGGRMVSDTVTTVDSATRKLVDKRGSSDVGVVVSEGPSRSSKHARIMTEILYGSFDVAVGIDRASGTPSHLPSFGPPLVTITSLTPKVSLVVPYNAVTVNVTFDRFVQAWVVRVGGHTPWEGSLVAQWSGSPRLSDSIQVDSSHLEGGSNDLRVYAQAVSGDWSGIRD